MEYADVTELRVSSLFRRNPAGWKSVGWLINQERLKWTFTVGLTIGTVNYIILIIIRLAAYLT